MLFCLVWWPLFICCAYEHLTTFYSPTIPLLQLCSSLLWSSWTGSAVQSLLGSSTRLCYASNLVCLLCSHMMNQHQNDGIIFHPVYLDSFALMSCCINLTHDRSGTHYGFCTILSPFHTCSLPLKCSEIFPALGHVWMGGVIDIQGNLYCLLPTSRSSDISRNMLVQLSCEWNE